MDGTASYLWPKRGGLQLYYRPLQVMAKTSVDAKSLKKVEIPRDLTRRTSNVANAQINDIYEASRLRDHLEIVNPMKSMDRERWFSPRHGRCPKLRWATLFHILDSCCDSASKLGNLTSTRKRSESQLRTLIQTMDRSRTRLGFQYTSHVTILEEQINSCYNPEIVITVDSHDIIVPHHLYLFDKYRCDTTVRVLRKVYSSGMKRFSVLKIWKYLIDDIPKLPRSHRVTVHDWAIISVLQLYIPLLQVNPNARVCSVLAWRWQLLRGT
ncbi:hypothetical protein EJ05DRAFT_508853 [Pseudovirgaria hyperparasitica]|uniref:Uncharacterized protein n=1 Tax=Pseudovirgaria hyperparasitica TaxID=470096 RepID=A0A6A6WE82_9PEZI|nr:uncharacterized protein EJ05DRAFT_508853 [Pseudovirgaria hyperparasitica]KAF2760300.1 hypothetical protein EJ05DRAFT_508853 [Pseudovirgaria hyperparasitica]